MATDDTSGAPLLGSLDRDGSWLRRAAVLSVFKAGWIAPDLGDTEVDRLAEFLSADCERVADTSGRPWWRLRDDVRARVLRAVPRGELIKALDSASSRPRDPVQTALEAYLGGLAPEPELLDATGLSAVLQVERWAGEGTRLADLGTIKARLDWLVLTEPLQRLLAPGFFGQGDLLRECRSFVARETTVPSDPFLLEGEAGTGKSTVLARLILDPPEPGYLAAYVSLDRGWILTGGGRAIFDEIVRQVGLQMPAKAADASALRQQVQHLASRAKGYPGIASRRSHLVAAIDREMIESLAGLIGDHRRLLVTLDTTEELARRDHAVVGEVGEFLADLSGLIPAVRIIAAGRVLPERFVGRRWRLTGLGEADALALLGALTSSRPQPMDALNEIVRRTGGNPLSLRLAADALNRTDEDLESVVAVAEGNVHRQPADARRAAGLSTLDSLGGGTIRTVQIADVPVRPKGRPGRKPKGSVPVVIPETPDKPDPDHVLTWRQRKVLQVIRDSVQKRGYPPSMREIGKAVGLTSTSSVSYQLSVLQRKGYLHRDAGRPRTVEVRLPGHPAGRPEQSTGGSPGHELPTGGMDIASQEAAYVPLVGRIAAGGPILAEEQVEDIFPLPRQLVGEGSLFMLKVAGDSMISAGIADGDWVVIRQQENAMNGEIVAAMIDGEATVKSLKQSDGHVWLMPHNPAYTPIFGDDATILGKVVAVLRKI
jgi:repressor LexA